MRGPEAPPPPRGPAPSRRTGRPRQGRDVEALGDAAGLAPPPRSCPRCRGGLSPRHLHPTRARPWGRCPADASPGSSWLSPHPAAPEVELSRALLRARMSPCSSQKWRKKSPQPAFAEHLCGGTAPQAPPEPSWMPPHPRLQDTPGLLGVPVPCTEGQGSPALAPEASQGSVVLAALGRVSPPRRHTGPRSHIPMGRQPGAGSWSPGETPAPGRV